MKENVSRSKKGAEPFRPEAEGQSFLRDERVGSESTKGFRIWLTTFLDCLSAAIEQSRRSRIDGLTRRCYRD